MRYRREDANGDFSFGCGDDSWLVNSADAVAQAVKTRFELWSGQWFLDINEGTPWMQSVLGKQHLDTTGLAIRQRLLRTEGVESIMAFETFFDASSRRVTFTAMIDTHYGPTTVTGEV